MNRHINIENIYFIKKKKKTLSIKMLHNITGQKDR